MADIATSGVAAIERVTGPDPMPWVHVHGERVADPYADGSPIGGYTYLPREGYSDYPDRYISTRVRGLEVGLDA